MDLDFILNPSFSVSIAVSELDFLAGSAHVACVAAPAVGGELEWSVVLVAKERPGLAAPVAPYDVRIAEFRILAKDVRGDDFFIADQVVAAQDLSRRGANGLHEASSVVVYHQFFHPFANRLRMEAVAEHASGRPGGSVIMRACRDRLIRRVYGTAVRLQDTLMFPFWQKMAARSPRFPVSPEGAPVPADPSCACPARSTSRPVVEEQEVEHDEDRAGDEAIETVA
jgi:hypothetical protein